MPMTTTNVTSLNRQPGGSKNNREINFGDYNSKNSNNQ